MKRYVKVAAATIHAVLDQIGPIQLLAITRAVLEDDLAYMRRHGENQDRANIETMFEQFKDLQLAADEAYRDLSRAIQYELKTEPTVMNYRKVRQGKQVPRLQRGVKPSSKIEEEFED